MRCIECGDPHTVWHDITGHCSDGLLRGPCPDAMITAHITTVQLQREHSGPGQPPNVFTCEPLACPERAAPRAAPRAARRQRLTKTHIWRSQRVSFIDGFTLRLSLWGGTGSPPRSSEPRRTAEGMSRLNLPSFNHWEKSPRGYEYIYPLHLQPPATSDHQSVTAPASWPCI
ncbi:hypothetical protein VZT92_021746 [Zoarces viviparus]|uniref:Uncharacterized protein n=1 Tax=Zoarces viviparus TaxID=48416 RepID=A0AAW1E984_ZOAVI